MGEIMTMEEMESRFKDEWILIEDPETTEMLQVTRGKVLWHGKDKKELYRVALELRPRSSAIWYIGIWPKDKIVIL
jgi:hypothetical protein